MTDQKHQILGEHHIPAACRSKTRDFKMNVKLLSVHEQMMYHKIFSSLSIEEIYNKRR